MSTHAEVSKFTDYPFTDSLKQDLAAAGFETPTPIQAQAIGPALEGRDVIGLAQTGTGKTAAFALPIIQRLAHRMELGALVLAPTRELAAQIVAVFRALGRTSGVRVISIVGGVKMENDWKALRSWPNVLVATPGRLLDHLEQKSVSLKEIEIFVVDEADRMHDMGFIPQIRRIIAVLPPKRQTMMFTATMPADVERIVRQSMHQAVKILAGPASRPVERAAQTLYGLQDDEKMPLLLDLLRKETGRVLVFVRTKRGVDRLARRVIDRRLAVARIHGDREQGQRDEAMKGFREGRYRVLIATDIAARGLDVADIEHVINFDFPRSAEDYIHRIGRTARLAATGRATSFVTPADRAYLRDLEKLLGAKIALTPAPAGRSSGTAAASHGHARPTRAHARPTDTHAKAPHGRGTGAAAAAHGHVQPKHTHEAGAAREGGGGRRGRRRRGRRGGASTAHAAPAHAPGTIAPAPKPAAHGHGGPRSHHEKLSGHPPDDLYPGHATAHVVEWD